MACPLTGPVAPRVLGSGSSVAPLGSGMETLPCSEQPVAVAMVTVREQANIRVFRTTCCSCHGYGPSAGTYVLGCDTVQSGREEHAASMFRVERGRALS
jgi:hypothetical protein